MLPLDTSCEAEYKDGYIHSETQYNDVSPYDPIRNIFYDILKKTPEADHGPMVRFSVFYKNARYDIDWTSLPENARPIRFRDGNKSINTGTNEEKFWWSGCRMGYQYNDENGKNIQEVIEL